MARGPVTLTINGEKQTFAVAPETPLLFILRNDCALNGPKFGCGLGECGACSVLVDDRCVRACTIKISALDGRTVTTLEGLASDSEPHPVQRAFTEMQAAQCGYCLNGMIIATVALLRKNPAPGEAEIRAALRGHLCRCGTHMEILAAVRRARDLLVAERQLPRQEQERSAIP
ncbi:(2Fe-2S)-binding protein [Rhizobium sp. SL86]|uniref:(2Fe-2S)-binding protein n=1 Tax=Rhizobium sp. SL86 TaxID=2995148 RepID=UPI002272FA88|nr:(2Fe-2S)-binding protein [Rhizobium sp. SL86]MCY1666828.1 (2Fe-2S)-binding protein [Rhizobium sp. SL86]